MHWAALTITITYAVSLGFIFLYSLAHLHLAFTYLRHRRRQRAFEARLTKPLADDQWPLVTVQLPIYNEQYVVERLIDTMAALDYPNGKLEIQLLDDSTDETVGIIDRKVASLPAGGHTVNVIRRVDRVGYKAGALKEGLTLASGEFLAIFDADFLPEKDFLRKTVPALVRDPKVGVVQTRWQHLNRGYSLLTHLQAFGLDAHFTIEQVGRLNAGAFINFNGTAGVWRKETILDAGNWQADTLTEDLDLSYRAQLRHWKFAYLEQTGAPAELPATMNALKSQQFRWTKGAAENARKNLGRVLRGKVSGAAKFHALFHLLNSALFPCILASALVAVPALFFFRGDQVVTWEQWLVVVLKTSFLGLGISYGIAYFSDRRFTLINLLKYLYTYPLFLVFSMGLSLHNAMAVLEGYAGKKTPFIRTPKFNLVNTKGAWNDKRYRALRANPMTILEGLLALYFAGGLFWAFHNADYLNVPYLLMLTLGFGAVAVYSLRHAYCS